MKQQGFTILELLIATLIFSVILLLCAAALIQLGRVYYKGVIRNQTLETTRLATDVISQAIQFSGKDSIVSPITANNGSQGFCVDNRRFSYVQNVQMSDSPGAGQTAHAFVVDDVSGCSSAMPAQDLRSGSVTGRELLAPRMRIQNFSLTQNPADNMLWQINLKVLYGDDNLINSSGTCVSSGIGGEFCAQSSLNTTVRKRL
jgi:prepilin-type N-terminal cleavage/methylation domain-containing protein